MELSCKRCLSKLPIKLLRGTAAQKLPCEGTVTQKLPYELCLQPLHATVVQKLLLSLFLKLLHGTVVQKLPFEAISSAFVCDCRAKVGLRGYLSR